MGRAAYSVIGKQNYSRATYSDCFLFCQLHHKHPSLILQISGSAAEKNQITKGKFLDAQTNEITCVITDTLLTHSIIKNNSKLTACNFFFAALASSDRSKLLSAISGMIKFWPVLWSTICILGHKCTLHHITYEISNIVQKVLLCKNAKCDICN